MGLICNWRMFASLSLAQPCYSQCINRRQYPKSLVRQQHRNYHESSITEVSDVAWFNTCNCCVIIILRHEFCSKFCLCVFVGKPVNVTLNIFVNSISSIDDFNMVCLHFENYFFCKLQCLRLKLNPISLKLTKLHFYSQSSKTNLHNIYIYSYISRNILSLHMYKYFFNGILGLPKAVLQTSLPKSRQKDSLEKN